MTRWLMNALDCDTGGNVITDDPHHAAQAYALRIARLEAVLAATAERLDKVADEIQPPNEFTPRLMMLANGIRHEINK
ncbi:MAG: hypothetical protein Q7R45_08335 [Sulfuricaulis sp.]|nr:hypothetical protein [Sulfuricaulis sp.]